MGLCCNLTTFPATNMLLAILLRCVCPEATSTSLALLCNPDAVLHRGLNRALDSMNFAQPLRFAPCPGLVIGACLGCPRSWVLMSFHLSLYKAFKLPPRPSRYLHCRCFPSVSPSPPSSVARALLRAWSPDSQPRSHGAPGSLAVDSCVAASSAAAPMILAVVSNLVLLRTWVSSPYIVCLLAALPAAAAPPLSGPL